ncbi:10839_t:CDS:2, partial [Funneliformis geosporum]
QYNEWMSDEVHELTLAGRIKKPAYNGTEDDYIFDYDLLKDNVENEPVKEEILIDENMYSNDIENYENSWN